MSILRAALPTSASQDRADGAGEGERVATPASADEHDRLVADGFAHYAARRFAEALGLINRALETRPGAGDALYARASILFAWGRLHEALPAFKRAEAAGVDHAEFYLYRGRSYLASDAKEAERCMRKVVALKPDWWEGHLQLAALLLTRKQLDEAIREYEQALELHPGSFDCHTGLGNCEMQRNDAIAAEKHYRDAVDVDPSRAEAWGNLGFALDRLQRGDEALAAFEQAQRLDSKTSNVDAYYNVALALADGDSPREALALYEANLAERPGVLAYNGYVQALLRAGKLVEGWNLQLFRWLVEQYVPNRPRFPRPRWDGQDLRGKTILLIQEQGLGDTIQFLRYVPFVKATGAKVLLLVQGPLQELVKGLQGVDHFIEGDGAYAFDTYLHLMSLPDAFGTELHSIPSQVPYLRPDPATAERWKERLHDGPALKVGLVWAGNPHHTHDKERSIPLKRLAPLMRVKGVRFFLLQKGPAAAETASLDSGMDVVDLGPELGHFGDTAAVISHLDLVISVDTSVAHLAGALGKPVWLMAAKPFDWRWLREGENNPWYPTMRLFRQTRRYQWDDVVARVTGALDEFAQNRVLPVTEAARVPPPAIRPVARLLPRLRPGHRPGFCAVAECRHGIYQYFPDEALVGDSLGWYGEYLQAQLDLLLRLVRPGAAVLEAAAGVGAHTLALARASGPDGYLLAYESRRVVRRVLNHNLAANDVRNVTVMQPVEQSVESGAPDDEILEAVDDLQLERLDLLKINEGVDALAVITDASDTLWRLRPVLFIAARDEAALKDLTAQAQDYGYRCWRMQTPLFSPGNFNVRQDDIFGGRSVLALLAIPEEARANIAFGGCVEL